MDKNTSIVVTRNNKKVNFTKEDLKSIPRDRIKVDFSFRKDLVLQLIDNRLNRFTKDERKR
jgi:hypothetical protein